jgi:hypothetical protein
MRSKGSFRVASVLSGVPRYAQMCLDLTCLSVQRRQLHSAAFKNVHLTTMLNMSRNNIYAWRMGPTVEPIITTRRYNTKF